MVDDDLNEFERRLEEIEESSDPHEMAATAALDFLHRRGGFSDWFDSIDAETRVEIVEGVVDALRNSLGG